MSERYTPQPRPAVGGEGSQGRHHQPKRGSTGSPKPPPDHPRIPTQQERTPPMPDLPTLANGGAVILGALAVGLVVVTIALIRTAGAVGLVVEADAEPFGLCGCDHPRARHAGPHGPCVELACGCDAFHAATVAGRAA